MITCNEIPHLKLYRFKTKLPNEIKDKKGNLVLLYTQSLDSSINLMNDKNIIDLNKKYRYYYMDNRYRGKYGVKAFIRNITTERAENYKKLRKHGKLGVLNVKNLEAKNAYIDLFYYNNLFFSQTEKLNYRRRTEEYMKFLKSIFNDERYDNLFNYKMVIIDIKEWESNVKKNIGVKNFNNPIFNIYFNMLRNPELFIDIGDIDIFFKYDNNIIRLNPSECDNKSFREFKKEITRIKTKLPIIPNSDEEVDSQVGDSELIDMLSKNFVERYRLVGSENEEVSEEISDEEDEVEEKIKKIVEDEVEEAQSKPEEISDEEMSKRINSKINQDKELLKQMMELKQNKKTGKTNTSLARDKKLKEEQIKIKLESMTIEDILKNDDISLETKNVEDKVKTTNKNATKITFPHFEKSYNEKLLKKDLINIFLGLNDKSIPIFIKDVKIEDSSDEMSYKETYTIQLEDSNRVRHTLKFDMPKFIDDKFMYLNGNYKIINKQYFMKPIVKTRPNEVQIVTNYSKIFIRRYGDKLNSKVERFRKLILSNNTAFKYKTGDCSANNTNVLTTIEYDILSKQFISIKTGDTEITFDQHKLNSLDKTKNIKAKDDNLLIGFTGTKPIFLNTSTQNIEGTNLDIVSFLLEEAKKKNSKIEEQYSAINVGKKYMYTRAKVKQREVPLILLLSYYEGLSDILRRANINHEFTDKRPRIGEDKDFIQFSNGYLVYDKFPIENSLLMQGFNVIDTRNFEYEEFDDRNTYLIIFDALFNTRAVGQYFLDTYEVMIDPITKEVLEDLNYPNNLSDLIIYANRLLSDNQYTVETDTSLYRVRSNEMVVGLLYQEIARAYCTYMKTSNNNNPVKMSIPRDVVLKKVLTHQTIEDYSKLNPIVELEKSRAITPKGLAGLNVSRAYTEEKRAFDPTMSGLMAMSTSPDANCGVVRELTLEPKILNARGYIDNSKTLDELKDVNMFSPAELLSPLGASRDDAIRTAMAVKQSKHIIPVKKASPVLISNGVEQTIHYHLGNDFAATAEEDGQVVEVNDKLGLMILKYKSGKTRALDLNPQVVKNGAGGFFLSNKLETKLVNGSKFKKNDILAYNDKFFSDDGVNGNRFNIGSIQKVACYSADFTMEDSCMMTKKASIDLSSEIVMPKQVVIGKNSNVDYIVKVGQEVTEGDQLIRFESSFNEESLNQFLANVGDELAEEIRNVGRTEVKSKYTGVIEDIKIYSTVDLEDMSPSLRKIVSNHYKAINDKKKLLSKYDNSSDSSIIKCGLLLNEPTEKLEAPDGKIKGVKVGEGVLIEFYIKYVDVLGIGDKITNFTALKSIVAKQIKEGYEPFSEYRPDEEISTFIAPGAIMARMTPSINLTMFGYKVLIELKRHLRDIYEE